MNKCGKCGGDGWYSEPAHAPGCGGECWSCPVEVQVQCERCNGSGREGVEEKE